MLKLSILGLMSLALVACSACAKTDKVVVDSGSAIPSSVPVEDAAPPEQTMTVSGSHWQFVLPNKGWHLVLDEQPKEVSVLVNQLLQNVVIVEDRLYSGSLEQLTLDLLRELRDTGATIHSAKQVKVGERQFVLVDSSKDDAKGMIWLTKLNDSAVLFHCGGPTNFGAEELCRSLFGSFRVSE